MPGPRQPLTVLEAKGRKHLSEREKAERAAGEIHAVADGPVEPPAFLRKKKQQEEFRDFEKRLRGLGIFSELDADSLGMYLLAKEDYLNARKEATKAIRAKHSELASAWTAIQDRYFKQARACANDMGLTVTSRCRLVVPQQKGGDEDSPFEKMMRERMQRA